LKMIPGLGKLWTSRIVRLSSSASDLSDVKGPRDLQFNWNLKSLDVVDACVRRSTPQFALQLFQRGFRTLRNYFNRSIGEIAREPAELQPLGLTHDKPPEPHALNAAPDNPAPEAHFARRRRHT
jgi:hypothetical protein